MRLNFSGVNEDEIREGVRRIGKVIAEQVELYEALTREQRLPERAAEADAAVGAEGVGESTGADDSTVVPFRKAAEGGR